MSTELIFKVAFFALSGSLVAVRGFFGWQARRAGLSSWFEDDPAPEREGNPSGLLSVVIPLGFLGLLVLYGVSSWLTAPLPPWLRWVGVGLGVMSLPLQIWVHGTLQVHWVAARQRGESHALITSGPYRWVRHPMYGALLLLFVGLALTSAFWPFLLLVGLAIPFFHRTAGQEEGIMIARFGGVYRDYVRRTGRFLPRLRITVRQEVTR